MTDPSPSSGLPTRLADTIAATQGRDIVFESPASCDPAGNCATGRITLSIDLGPPVGHIEVGGGVRFTSRSLVFVEAPASDPVSGLAAVDFSGDGVHWSTSGGTTTRLWDLADPSFGGTPGSGERTIHVRWTDVAGNKASAKTTVLVDPGKVSRLAGADRFATAAAISRATFAPGVPVAYVATAYDFPDALAGAAVAGRTGGPVLLSRSVGLLDPRTAAELVRLRPAQIVILGGTGVVSSGIEGHAWPTVGHGAELPAAPEYFGWSPLDDLLRDADGIALASYPWGDEYNPVTISQVALAAYSQWLGDRSAAHWTEFIRHVEWLVLHQEQNGLWLYSFPFGGQPIPWWSAMAEGQAISALLRAYRITGDKRYSTVAQRALVTFTRLQSDGGVVSVDHGYRWYEEYMPPYAPHTLNGFMFSLIGLWEYALTVGDARSRTLFDDGIRTLAHELYRFDDGTWSCYCLIDLTRCHRTSVKYHELHIAQLRYLYSLTGIDVFARVAARWQGYLTGRTAAAA